MKRKVMAVMLAAMTAVSLAACGGSDSSGAADTPSADGGATEAAEETTDVAAEASSDEAIKASGSSDALQVLIWDTNQQPGLQQILDDFTAETGIKTDLQVKDWNSYWTALEAAATGGAMPDVFWMHSNNAQVYMNNGMLLDLDPYIEKSDKIDLANYMEGVTNLYTYNGTHYAIPKDYDTIALWYNKTMFDEAGISYPDETWTWDDLLDAAKKLTKDDGSQYGYALQAGSNQDCYYNMIYSHGGYVLSDDKKTSGYDDPKTIEAMQKIAELLQSCPDANTLSESGPDVLIESGTVAMCTQGSWMIPAFKENDYMKENCDVAVLPYDKETGVRVSICNGLGWAASASTTRPDDCWKLIEWLGSKEEQMKQTELGITMSAYNGTSDAWVNNTDAFNIQVYLDEANEEKTGDATNKLVYRPFTYKTTTWEGDATDIFSAAWADPSTMEDACKQAAQTMNDDIAQEAAASN
jgi:multiple sugar transport system substrate-binding protein